MNLHGYLARERIFYGSDEGTITNIYLYGAKIRVADRHRIAIERGTHFQGLLLVLSTVQILPCTPTRFLGAEDPEGVRQLPTPASASHAETGVGLATVVQAHGRFAATQNLQAVPPTVDLAINHSTSSIHPIVSKVEIRKEGQDGRAPPAPYMTNDNLGVLLKTLTRPVDRRHRHLRSGHPACGSAGADVLQRHRHHPRRNKAQIMSGVADQDAVLHPGCGRWRWRAPRSRVASCMLQHRRARVSGRRRRAACRAVNLTFNSFRVASSPRSALQRGKVLDVVRIS